MRTLWLTVGMMWTGLPAVAVEPQTILEQTNNLRPEVLELALEAYEQAEAGGHVRRPVLTIIDYELPSYQQRLWTIDMKVGRVLHQEWVAHGMGKPRGSGGTMEEALWSLLVLLTTANYPDVMMPAYAASRAAVAFFATFEIVGNWFLLNVVHAVVYKGHSDMLQATGPNPLPPPTRTSDP